MNTPTVRAALAELVALKDLKNRIAATLNEHTYFQGGKELIAEYERRKPLAWAAARAALAEPAAPVQPLTDERALQLFREQIGFEAGDLREVNQRDLMDILRAIERAHGIGGSIGPFASQAQKLNVRIRAALKGDITK